MAGTDCNNEDCVNPNCTCVPYEYTKEKPYGYLEHNWCEVGSGVRLRVTNALACRLRTPPHLEALQSN